MRADVRGKIQSFAMHPFVLPPSPSQQRHSGESRRFSGRNVHPEGQCNLESVLKSSCAKNPYK